MPARRRRNGAALYPLPRAVNAGEADAAATGPGTGAAVCTGVGVAQGQRPAARPAGNRRHERPGTRGGFRQSATLARTCKSCYDRALRQTERQAGRKPDIQGDVLKRMQLKSRQAALPWLRFAAVGASGVESSCYPQPYERNHEQSASIIIQPEIRWLR
jgi:hypothetical protein